MLFVNPLILTTMATLKFYVCKHCGNVITYLKESGVKVICCGEPMTKMVPNISDGAGEKHVPVIHKDGPFVTVKVGSVAHPMLDEHYIQWIMIETNNGFQLKHLSPGMKPEARFVLAEGEDILSATYEYCNLHSLWAAK